MNKFNGLWIGQLGNANSWYHIYPFAMAPSTDTLFIVRHSAPKLPVPKSQVYSFIKRGKLYNSIALFIKSRKVIKQHKINFIITFNPAPYGSVAWVISKLFRIPISVGLIGTDFNVDLKKMWYKNLLVHILRKSESVTVAGNAMRPYLESKNIPHHKISIYPHCVHDSWLENVRNKNCKYDLISVGWFHKGKRFDVTIEALSILKKRGINLKLVIIGDGNERSYLESKIAEYELENFVEMPGLTENILDYYKDSRIFVQTSDKEGLSLSLIEAISLGVVPVVTNAGSEKDVISNNKNGLIVSIGDPYELADAIEKLCDENTYNKFHEELISTRDRFKMKSAIQVADEIIKRIAN